LTTNHRTKKGKEEEEEEEEEEEKYGVITIEFRCQAMHGICCNNGYH